MYGIHALACGCVFECMHKYTCIYYYHKKIAWLYMCMYMYMYTCICCMDIYTCECTCICMYLIMYICVDV